MHRLLWLVPLALIALAIWLPSLLPLGVLAFLGHVLLTLGGIGGVVFLIMWLLAAGMKS